ncbi:uncharacterized protein LOC120414445 [Culex pipiens pallens]|uniref:uncharacterized protein LOC120414445 n=1 Tax=Culex pipiens pallens TaxID=42434 RepID=UPI001953850A|nr:uncharacterized protein LOC120414445 [Culex pipiens pallens]
MALLALSVRHPPVALRPFALAILFGQQRKSTNVDAIDSFISELVENKTLKWKVLNNKNRAPPRKNEAVVVAPSPVGVPSRRSPFRLTQIFDDLTSNPLVVNIEPLEQTHIDNLVETAIQEGNEKDVHLLFDQMLEYRRVPSRQVLKMMCEYFAGETDRKRLEQLVGLCRIVLPEQTALSKDYLHYKALLQWKMGNSLKALENFKEALQDCPAVTKQDINRLLQGIVDETIGKKSEAVLLAVIELGEFCMFQLKDEFLLCYVWEGSFRSQWFSDQEAARALFDKHAGLRVAIARRLGKLCFTYMQEFNAEPVYRLMELFLKHKMLPQCQQVLVRLFEYQYWRRDLRACSEIMQNSIDLDITLPDIYNRKLLDLLLGRTTAGPRLQHSPVGAVSSSSSAAASGAAPPDPKRKAKSYELKF